MKRKCIQCGKQFNLNNDQIAFYKSKNLQLPKRCKECRLKNKMATGKINGVSDYSKSSVSLENISEENPNNKKPNKLTGLIIVAAALLLAGVVGISSFIGSGSADNRGQDSGKEYKDLLAETENPNNNKVTGIGEVASVSSEEEHVSTELNSTEDESQTEETATKQTSMENSLKEAMIVKETESIDPFAEDSNDNGANQVSQASYTFKNQSLKDEHYYKHGVDMGFESADAYEQAAAAVVNNPSALHKKEAEDGDDVYYIEASNEFVIVSKKGFIRTYFNPDAGKAYYDRQ